MGTTPAPGAPSALAKVERDETEVTAPSHRDSEASGCPWTLEGIFAAFYPSSSKEVSWFGGALLLALHQNRLPATSVLQQPTSKYKKPGIRKRKIWGAAGMGSAIP